MKYFAKVIDELKRRPNEWKGLKVGVFNIENDVEEQVGEYERNYSSLFNTFFHFQQNGKDFALYSPDYTVTRIMELPSCKDIGGEEPSAGGFCPTDYFVPTFIVRETIWETTSLRGKIDEKNLRKRINNPKKKELSKYVESYEFTNGNTGELCKSTMTHIPLTPLTYYPFGFVAGCLWGDDSSWKIQYLDLSKIEKGIINRKERFGYIEMPNKVKLRKAIKMYGYGNDSEDYSNYIRINHVQTFDLRNGKVVDPFE